MNQKKSLLLHILVKSQKILIEDFSKIKKKITDLFSAKYGNKLRLLEK